MQEHIRSHPVIIPDKTVPEILFDRMPVDIGKIPFLYIPVEDPHAHIDTENSRPCLNPSLL
jgi:hypothetical protein